MKNKRLSALVGSICLVLVLVALPFMAACPAPAEETTTPTELEYPLGKAVIRIGGQDILTGANADYGRQMMYGAKMAIDEINTAGGILGSKIEMNFLDSELTPGVAVRNARWQTKEWDADVLFGLSESACGLAMGPLMDELDRVFFICHAADSKLTEEMVFKDGYDKVFDVMVNSYQETYLPALFFKDWEDIKTIGFLSAAYGWGYNTRDAFRACLTKYRPDIKTVAETEAGYLTMDFTPQLTKLMAAKPNLIYSTPWAGEGVAMIRQAMDMGIFEQDWFKGWFMAMGGSVDTAEGIAADVKAGKTNGKLWATARYLWNQNEKPSNVKFVDGFRELFGRYPNYSAANAYATIYLIKSALEETKSLDTDRLVAALKGRTFQAPEGERWFRPEDNLACYSVPIGRYTYDESVCPNAYLTDLFELPWRDYYSSPPNYELP